MKGKGDVLIGASDHGYELHGYGRGAATMMPASRDAEKVLPGRCEAHD